MTAAERCARGWRPLVGVERRASEIRDVSGLSVAQSRASDGGPSRRCFLSASAEGSRGCPFPRWLRPVVPAVTIVEKMRSIPEKGEKAMKTVAIALMLLGFIAGCASQQSPSPSAATEDRPDLVYKTKSDCEKAGRLWNGTSSVCH